MLPDAVRLLCLRQCSLCSFELGGSLPLVLCSWATQLVEATAGESFGRAPECCCGCISINSMGFAKKEAQLYVVRPLEASVMAHVGRSLSVA
jgi:hypothetical protein